MGRQVDGWVDAWIRGWVDGKCCRYTASTPQYSEFNLTRYDPAPLSLPTGGTHQLLLL